MVITPVSGIDAGSSVNKYTSFGHRRNNADNVPDVHENRGSNNLAKVPVVVLMAMSPAMLNANHPKTNIETEAPAKTEMVTAPAKLDTEALDELTAAYPGVDGLQQSGKYDYLKKKWHGVLNYEAYKIRKADIFNINGEKFYMIYSGIYNDNAVTGIDLVPESFNKTSAVYIPAVRELVYHDLGPGKEFCSVKVESFLGRDSNCNRQCEIKDIRIPDEVANNLLAFLANDTQYKNETHIIATKTKSAALQPDKKIH